MGDTNGAGGFHRLRHLPDQRPGGLDWRGCQPAQADVERFGRDVLHREIRGGAFKACVEQRDHCGMFDGDRRQALQNPRKPGANLRHDIEPESLDGDEFFLLRIKRPKNWSQDATADLVQDAKGAEGSRRGESGGVVEWQCRNSLNDHCTLARGIHPL